MINYLSAEQPIKDKLKAAIPELAAVYGAAELDDIPETQRQFPAVHVLYFDDKVITAGTGRSTDGKCVVVDQSWYIILAVRNVKDQITGEAARKDAGPLAMKVLKAMQGFQPTIEHGPLMRTSGVRAGYKAGYLYLPFLFTTRVTI